jgi:catechol 2,3-dioxygenase-like lactoylglutathione lyase family enzyme
VFSYVHIVDTSGKVQRPGKGLYLKLIMGMSGVGNMLALNEVVDASVGPQGVSHFGLFYNEAKVEAITKKVESCGGTIIEKGLCEDNGVKESFAYVRDPDGYVIKISSQQIVFFMDFRR